MIIVYLKTCLTGRRYSGVFIATIGPIIDGIKHINFTYICLDILTLNDKHTDNISTSTILLPFISFSITNNTGCIIR